MSMNAMSFESRLTIITTDVGSVILTSCASQAGRQRREHAAAMSAAGDDVSSCVEHGSYS